MAGMDTGFSCWPQEERAIRDRAMLASDRRSCESPMQSGIPPIDPVSAGGMQHLTQACHRNRSHLTLLNHFRTNPRCH